jgi:hypothetical protein
MFMQYTDATTSSLRKVAMYGKMPCLQKGQRILSTLGIIARKDVARNG